MMVHVYQSGCLNLARSCFGVRYFEWHDLFEVQVAPKGRAEGVCQFPTARMLRFCVVASVPLGRCLLGGFSPLVEASGAVRFLA